MRISDEIRNWIAWCKPWWHGENSVARDELWNLADRIDAEMVELPKDADGVPICAGDTLYDCKDGHQYQVRELRLDDAWGIWTNYGFASASNVTHERPDSFERIADELEKWFDKLDTWSDGVYVDKNACPELREFSDRIRKLATKEDK